MTCAEDIAAFNQVVSQTVMVGYNKIIGTFNVQAILLLSANTTFRYLEKNGMPSLKAMSDEERRLFLEKLVKISDKMIEIHQKNTAALRSD